MFVVNCILMYYMKKPDNKFTIKFALSSRNVLPVCELVVNPNASYALNNSNMGVNLWNKQDMWQRAKNKEQRTESPMLHALCPLVRTIGFVRSLFAH